MESHEDILLIRVEKFLVNMKDKHTVSASFINSIEKIINNLKVYEVGLVTIDEIYEQIHWAESHDNFKEVEAEFKTLADTFWE